MQQLPTILDGEDKSSLFKNCIRNHYRHVRKWAKRSDCNAFRLYDREMSNYPFAIDYYDGRYCVHYFSPHREEDEPAQELTDEVEECLKSLFGAEPEAIYWRTRFKRGRTEQYEKVDEAKDFFTVREYGVQFWVNLVDYLDTGLFLDHRETRQLVAKASQGVRLLNLFSYTGAFSIQAATHGALATTSVDMSNTYCDWCRRNFELNSLPLTNHQIIRADCLRFLEEEVRKGPRYDVIIIDPPTLSRSKKMTQMFDIQEDYVSLIQQALTILTSKGKLFFSTNSRRFCFDETLFQGCSIKEITSKTIPIDFHNDRIHKAWLIEKF